MGIVPNLADGIGADTIVEANSPILNFNASPETELRPRQSAFRGKSTNKFTGILSQCHPRYMVPVPDGILFQPPIGCLHPFIHVLSDRHHVVIRALRRLEIKVLPGGWFICWE